MARSRAQQARTSERTGRRRPTPLSTLRSRSMGLRTIPPAQTALPSRPLLLRRCRTRSRTRPVATARSLNRGATPSPRRVQVPSRASLHRRHRQAAQSLTTRRRLRLRRLLRLRPRRLPLRHRQVAGATTDRAMTERPPARRRWSIRAVRLAAWGSVGAAFLSVLSALGSRCHIIAGIRI